MNILHSFKMNRRLQRARTAVFLTYMALISGVFGSDLEREKRMANEISEAILDGEPIWLSAGPIRFLGMATQAFEQPAMGNVSILHGRGYHTGWAEVVSTWLNRVSGSKGWVK